MEIAATAPDDDEPLNSLSEIHTLISNRRTKQRHKRHLKSISTTFFSTHTNTFGCFNEILVLDFPRHSLWFFRHFHSLAQFISMSACFNTFLLSDRHNSHIISIIVICMTTKETLPLHLTPPDSSSRLNELN